MKNVLFVRVGAEPVTRVPRQSLCLTIVAAFALLFLVAMPAAAAPNWWDNGWIYRTPLVVQNASTTTPLPVHYATGVTIDTSVLLAAGQLLPDCSDLRVVYFDGLSNHELDRLVDGCGSKTTVVWFALQRSIAAGGQDAGYNLYYGNAAAGPAPSNGMNVFLFYEDWESGAAHWNSAGGLDASNSGTLGTSTVVNENFVSPSHSQKFSQKTYGGDAFTGYVPVSPSTTYALSVWATSATATYFPVGFDPYDSVYNRGSERWLWTSEWTLGSQWSQRSAVFTTNSDTAYIKIKSEWWGEAPGTAPVYADNLALRAVAASEPTVTQGAPESSVPTPTITNVAAISPVQVGMPTVVSADVALSAGAIDQVSLYVLTPQTLVVPMTLSSGNSSNGTWTVQFTAAQGGIYTYAVSAHASNGTATLSSSQTFTVADTLPPQIVLLNITNPIQVNNTQTLSVRVTDNGLVSSVSLNVDGVMYPMVANGNTYSYSWRTLNAGTVSYVVQAIDTSGNDSVYSGTFDVQVPEVGVCKWLGCKQGAESFSVDDGYTACRTEMDAAGFRGTYYYPGSETQDWFADYSAAGHEIGSHTADHLCNTPCCSPNCTQQSLKQCQSTPDQIVSYRQSQLEPNIEAIEVGTGRPVISAAWPCGCTDPGRESAAAAYLLGARGFYDYVANLTWVEDVNPPDPADMMNLWAAHAYDDTFIDRAASEGKWAIIVSHGDCTGIDYMGQRQDVLWAAPVGQVLKYIKVRDAATFSNYSRSDNNITFDVAHNLGVFQRRKVDGSSFAPIVYDNPVTVMAHVVDVNTVGTVLVDGGPVPFSSKSIQGASYVLFDASLQATRHVVITLGQPATAIASIGLSSISLVGGNSLTGTVTLSAPAPTGGIVVSLSSSNPAAQVPASVPVAAAATTATFPITTSVVSSTTTAIITGVFGSSTQNATLTVTPIPVTLSSVTANPASVVGGNPSTGTVTLSTLAPTGGIVVSLSSNTPAAQVPVSVSVAAAATTATFPITTSVVSSTTAALITGVFGSSTQNATLTVTPVPVTLSSVTVNPTSVVGGNSSTGAVTLSGPAPAGGIVVSLSSNNPAAQVPASVTVLAGAAAANFTISTSGVSSAMSVTISGTYGTTKSAGLTVNPASLSTVSLSPATVVGGSSSTGTVTLTGRAAAGGAVITLASNNPAAQVGPSVTVAAGATTATFPVTTTAVASTTTASISATYSAVMRTATLTVSAPTPSSLSLNPTSVVGGKSSTATVTLSGPAPAGGAGVTLASSNPNAAQVPASLTLPAGSRTATFVITTNPVVANTSSVISAVLNGTTRTATLTVRAPSVSSLSLSPTSVVGGSTSTGTITLTGIVATGIVVAITSSNNTIATVPANVTVPGGSSTATFTINTTPTSSSTSPNITASYGGSSRSQRLTVSAPGLSSLGLNPSTVRGGSPSTGTVTLNGPAPSNGMSVTLSSSNTSIATVPSTVTVPAGSRTANFTVTSRTVTTTRTATITGNRNGTRSAVLTVTP
ncbi:MAG: hypothetical protein WA628_08905 [Terriglobales bacterium]